MPPLNPVFSFEFVPNELPRVPKREYKPYQGKEVNFQISVAYFLNSIGADFTHVANERKTEMRQKKDGSWYSPEGNKLKASGLKPGISDNLIFDQRHGYIGVCLELKVGFRKATPEQLDFMERRKKQGWYTLVSKSLDEVIAFFEWYYGIETIAQKF